MRRSELQSGPSHMWICSNGWSWHWAPKIFAFVTEEVRDLIEMELSGKGSINEGIVFYTWTDKGGLQRVNPSQFKEAKTAIDSDTYRDGEIVETWDHVFFWTPDCVPLRKWEQWRLLGDSLTDAALPEIMGPAGGSETDLLARQRSASQQHDSNHAAFRLYEFLNEQSDQFVWPDNEQIARGQAVLYRYAPQILASLLHFSLSAGFSSPRISRILNIASYLVPPMESTPEGEAPRISKESNDRSFQRLMETTQWVVDCIEPDALSSGGTG
ncbi:MAG: hypothetical protein MMC23_009845 [Stictis urceolatum]|nr:hypothetical protein [Stictis urceolata]